MIAACLLLAPPLSANDRYDDGAPGKGFNINLGAFVMTRVDTSVRFDSNIVPIGTTIGVEDTLDVDSSDTTGRIDGWYRFNERHRIDWTYYRSKRGGDAIATRDITIGDPEDPDGIDLISAGAQIESTWKYDMFKIGYVWSFLNKERYEWFIGTGLSIRNMDLDIAYRAGGSGSLQTDARRVKQTIPLPHLTIGGRWGITPKLDALWKYELFYVELGDYQGAQQDLMAVIEHQTFKNVGFGGGFNIVSLDLTANGSDFRGELDSSTAGVLVYLKAFF
jgi:hypothetical protein